MRFNDLGYKNLVFIPEGARDIFIQEVEEAGNFLAIRDADSDEYYLNGNYIIQWNGEYEAGGTKFQYDRSGNMENLTSEGPTTRPVMIQVLTNIPEFVFSRAMDCKKKHLETQRLYFFALPEK